MRRGRITSFNKIEEFGTMISYEEFEKHILFLKRQEEYNLKLQNLYREYRDIVGDVEAPLGGSVFNQIELLEKVIGIEEDEAGYSTLTWWIQQTEFGAKPENPLILDKVAPGEYFDFSTTKGIYDFLIREADWTLREKLRQRIENSKIDVRETEHGFVITMDSDILEGLNMIVLNDYNTTIEGMLYGFIDWVVSKPDEFKMWSHD